MDKKDILILLNWFNISKIICIKPFKVWIISKGRIQMAALLYQQYSNSAQLLLLT